ncbi:hypothetical protein G6F57_011684 [Rhizopus arrhizus]|nr:hypothetical protein G6F57_011684 [Rhizopus arrhizus]
MKSGSAALIGLSRPPSKCRLAQAMSAPSCGSVMNRWGIGRGYSNRLGASTCTVCWPWLTCSGPRRTRCSWPASSSPSRVLMPHNAPAWNTEAVTAKRSSRMARRSTMTGLQIKRHCFNTTDRIGFTTSLGEPAGGPTWKCREGCMAVTTARPTGTSLRQCSARNTPGASMLGAIPGWNDHDALLASLRHRSRPAAAVDIVAGRASHCTTRAQWRTAGSAVAPGRAGQLEWRPGDAGAWL